jgi:hypothetical protein
MLATILTCPPTPNAQLEYPVFFQGITQGKGRGRSFPCALRAAHCSLAWRIHYSSSFWDKEKIKKEMNIKLWRGVLRLHSVEQITMRRLSCRRNTVEDERVGDVQASDASEDGYTANRLLRHATERGGPGVVSYPSVSWVCACQVHESYSGEDELSVTAPAGRWRQSRRRGQCAKHGSLSVLYETQYYSMFKHVCNIQRGIYKLNWCF